MPVDGPLAKCSFCGWKEAHSCNADAIFAYREHMAKRHKTVNDFDRLLLERMRIEPFDGPTDS